MHEQETRRGWLCIGCAIEAAGYTERASIDRMKATGRVRTERVGRRIYYNRDDILDDEARRSAQDGHAKYASARDRQ